MNATSMTLRSFAWGLCFVAACGAPSECSFRADETRLEVGQLAEGGDIEWFTDGEAGAEIRVVAGPQGAIMAVMALRLVDADEGAVSSRVDVEYPSEGFSGTVERAARRWQTMGPDEQIWPSVFVVLSDSNRGLEPGSAEDIQRLQGSSVVVKATVEDGCARALEETFSLTSRYVQ